MTQGLIVVTDPDPEARAALGRLLESAGYEVLEAESGVATIELARGRVPAAVFLEIALPDLSGYEVCRVIRSELGSEVLVVFLSGVRTESYDRVAGLLLGADDYLTRPYAADEVLARLRNLLQRSPPAASSASAAELTPRESEVLTLLARGLDRQEIAGQLFISSKTVASHIENLLHKLGVHTMAQAIALAYREEIVRLSPAGIAERANTQSARSRA